MMCWNIYTIMQTFQWHWLIYSRLTAADRHGLNRLCERKRAGTRIAIVGFTAPFFLTYRPNGWQVKTVARMYFRIFCAIIWYLVTLIVLSHLGIEADRHLAKQYPEIDVVLVVIRIIYWQTAVHGTTLLAAEKYGHYVGK